MSPSKKIMTRNYLQVSIYLFDHNLHLSLSPFSSVTAVTHLYQRARGSSARLRLARSWWLALSDDSL